MGRRWGANIRVRWKLDTESNQTSLAAKPTTEETLTALVHEADEFSYKGQSYDILQAIASIDNELSARAAVALHNLEKALQDAVVNDGRFPGSAVIMLSRDNNGLSGFYPGFFGDALLRHALLSKSAAASLAWLEKVLRTREATGKLMFLLWGVHVAEASKVSPNVALCPLSAIPEGDTTRWIRKQYAGGRFDSLTPTTLEWAQPDAVLVMDIKIACFAQREPFPERTADESLADYYFLKDLLMLLAVAGPCSPILAASWTTLDDPDLAFACRGEGRSGTMHEIFSNQPPAQVDLNIEVLKICHANFLRSSNDDKSRIRTALKRIVQARMRHNLGDRAVELCTALETLGGDGESNEIIHKVATRFARFIGGDVAVRKKNFKLIKEVYGIRSKMVHQGIFISKRMIHDLSPEQAINYVIDLATKFVQKALEEMKIPDWHEFDITEQAHGDDSHRVGK